MLRPLGVLALAAAMGAAAAGCGDDGAPGGDRAALDVVATTPLVADLARAVGGDRVRVQAMLPRNADPHDYEPRPSDARAVAEADVVLQSGGDLDGWLDDVVASAGGDARRVALIDAVRTIDDGEDAEADPHWWQDPRNTVRAVERLEAAFAEADAAGRATYTANGDRYARRVSALDAAIERCMDTIPAARRKLVTSHDAFGYFADRYDIAILGAVVPGLSTSAQPSAGDVRRLVDAIRREGVRTVFPESALDQRLERAIAEEAGARVGPPLYADTLGPAGSPGATYLGALRHDARAIAEGFGGRCDLP